MSPIEFREKFFEHCDKSFFRSGKPFWDIQFHKRANLIKIPPKYHYFNDPWFIMTRNHVSLCIHFTRHKIYKIVLQGIIANESIFAIALAHYGKLSEVVPESTTICDWINMSTPTSPHLFLPGEEEEVKKLAKLPGVFLRKIHETFPDDVITDIIYKGAERTQKTEKEITDILINSFRRRMDVKWQVLGLIVLYISISIAHRNLDTSQMSSLVHLLNVSVVDSTLFYPYGTFGI
jgi:hypothetical protein